MTEQISRSRVMVSIVLSFGKCVTQYEDTSLLRRHQFCTVDYFDSFEPSRSSENRLTADHWRVNTSSLEKVIFSPVSGVNGYRVLTSFTRLKSLMHSLYQESLNHFKSTVWDLRLLRRWPRDSNLPPAHLQSSNYCRLGLRSARDPTANTRNAVLCTSPFVGTTAVWPVISGLAPYTPIRWSINAS